MQHAAASAFETQRLICRPFQQGDETDMFDYWAADEVCYCIEREEYQRSKEDNQ